MATADARTNEIGHAVRGGNDWYGHGNGHLGDLIAKHEAAKTISSDEIVARYDMPLHRVLDNEKLPKDASLAAGRLAEYGAKIKDLIRVDIHRAYKLSEDGTRVATDRGLRTVLYWRGIRCQNIKGHVFVDLPPTKYGVNKKGE